MRTAFILGGLIGLLAGGLVTPVSADVTVGVGQPDCSNVAPDARMAGCNDHDLFAVRVLEHDGIQPVEPEPAAAPEPEPEPDPDPGENGNGHGNGHGHGGGGDPDPV